jgi:hypothetical protein
VARKERERERERRRRREREEGRKEGRKRKKGAVSDFTSSHKHHKLGTKPSML